LRYNRSEAAHHLKSQCPRLGEFIEGCGPLGLKAAKEPDLFGALASAIVYQQLSGKAASTIHGRFCDLFAEGRPDAATAAGMDTAQLRSAGLSRNKALAILDLAGKAVDGTLLSRRRMARLDDAGVVQNLCQVRGIGPWTAQMFLIFNLGRPDVMPATDLGVQKGVQRVYRLAGLPDPEHVIERTRHLAPYRSAASWYFWQAADTALMA
jgi:3-methyladenine DNA glycosylase/8-oxoguanine DNA glycosylase